MRARRSIGLARMILAFAAIVGPAIALEPESGGTGGGGVEPAPLGADAEAPAPARAVPAQGSVAELRVEKVEDGMPKPPDGSPPSRTEILAMVDRMAGRHGLDLDLVHALIRAESAYDAHAVSPAGAVGLMQVMPATAADYGVVSVEALFDPPTNLDTGMRHLKRLLGRYGSIGPAVMAYNAGEGALERSAGFVTYPETQRYTHAVLVAYLRKKGVQPYTAQAKQLVGMAVTPAMAKAAVAGGGRSAELNTEAVSLAESQGRAPLTRLSSRLSPALSRRSEEESAAHAAESGVAQGVLERNRMRFARESR